jgi:hypothetical protein
MRFYSNRKFANLLGIKSQSVDLAVKNGKLRRTKHGIDLQDIHVISYLLDRVPEDRKSVASHAIDKALEDTTEYDMSEKEKQKEVSFELDDIEANIANIGKADIDKLKALESIKKLRFENEERRGQYIDRQVVTRFCMKLYAIDTSEFAMLAHNSAPEIASICGIDDAEVILEIQQYLEDKVYRVQEHIKRVLNEYLEGEGN